MCLPVNLTGKKFGKLTALLALSNRDKSGHIMWLCECECGNFTRSCASNLTGGASKSCGCQRRINTAESNKIRKRTHGKSRTTEGRRYYSSLRRARMRKANKEKISLEALEKHIDFLGRKCVYCGGPYEHLDHVVPLSRGGAHSLDNLVPSCAHCNLTKSKKIYPTEWKPNYARVEIVVQVT
jgi:5-methylcytosine-specific restriction endonuclease McrA